MNSFLQAFRTHLTILVLVVSALAASGQQPQPTSPPLKSSTLESQVNPTGLSERGGYGWQTNSIGAGRGIFDVSIGLKLWHDKFQLQNFTFGGAVELTPGLRLRANFRRRENDNSFFRVDPDEIYLEAFNHYRTETWEAGASLRLGRARYLHFPYPDAISQFDQVPGIGDLDGGVPTDYREATLAFEAALRSGWGVHFTGRAQAVSESPLARVVEAYGFYRSDFGRGWRFEGRLGAIANRREPLGRTAQAGGNVYLGKQVGEFNIGLLYENKLSEPEYTGIMVQFRPNPVTRALGKISFDYSRTPEGFSVQLPILHARINQHKTVRSGDILVGEVRAVRIRTLWQQGYVRNEYEHRVESWGETTARGLRCVVTEEPWYLGAEALVSPHLVPDARWERDRQGPAQYVQRVTYRFYKPFQRSTDT